MVYYIYNSDGILKHTFYGSFKENCDTYNLPYKALYKSYRNGGLPIYI